MRTAEMPNKKQPTFSLQKRWRFRPRNGRHLGIDNTSRDVTSGRRSIATTAPPPTAPVPAPASLGKRRRYSSRVKRGKRPKVEDQRLIIDPAGSFEPTAQENRSESAAECKYTAQHANSTSAAIQPVASNGSTREPEPSSSGAAANVANAKKGRRRVRRAPKHKWKPYFKLTNDERRLLEIREEKRAERVRALRFKKGLPVAPYNTTQFLFNDLQARGGGGSLTDAPMVDVDRIVESIRHHHRSESNDRDSVSVSADGSHLNNHNAEYDSESESTGFADLFNEKEFDNEYDSAFVERLSSLSKDELIKDYLNLEKQYERGQSDLMAKNQEIAQLKSELKIHASDTKSQL